MFQPIAYDMQEGVTILALQWTTFKSIEYLCLRIHDSSLHIHTVNISPITIKEAKCQTSYTIDNHFSNYIITSRQPGNKPCRYEFGANGGYFAGISTRSVEIWKSSSTPKPKHGFTFVFTGERSNTVRQSNTIEMQQGDEESDKDTESQSKKRGRDPDSDGEFQPPKKFKQEGPRSGLAEEDGGTQFTPDTQTSHLLKRNRDEIRDVDDGSLPVSKRSKI